MKSNLAAALAGAVLAALAPAVAAAQVKPNKSTSATVDIQVCNESGRNGTVAISYVEVGSGQFINRGWFEVANGTCQAIVSTDNANFYMYGDTLDGSGRTWSGNHPLCVQYPGPYTFWSDGSDSCPVDYEIRNFVAMHADDVGAYTWTLNP
ncbi:DUF1036 domain-containing protein [Brevundimonas sp.]|uniref:DUF1036 domain-containing protein n=1 Tax=Brevundimonas sp. TaxID=1871086 RepID=UPI002D32FB07|nr:DUF1036 domain-containing protein [Brevundimonas sp.]HYC68025.1 DUF1036 domain-containing protein [Brevundimonas sp.]